MSEEHDRRRFVKGLIGGLVGAAASWPIARAAGPRGQGGPPASPTQASSRSVVARARREVLGAGGAVDATALSAALGACVARSAGEEKPVAAMRRLFRPGDVVGIKVNCMGGRGISPRPELVDLITAWLQEAGLPARNILIWDRSDRELSAAGYRLNRGASGVRVFGTEKEYEWTPREWGPNASCFARVLVEDLTALINVGVVKDHGVAGVALGLKNWYGAIQNPNKCHSDGCHPFVAHLAAFPTIRDKLRLTVLDGLTAQCNGGPARSPRWAWGYGGVLASRDPVAIDAVGASIIEARRAEVGLPTLAGENRFPRWLAEAGRLGLGASDLSRIQVDDV